MIIVWYTRGTMHHIHEPKMCVCRQTAHRGYQGFDNTYVGTIEKIGSPCGGSTVLGLPTTKLLVMLKFYNIQKRLHHS